MEPNKSSNILFLGGGTKPKKHNMLSCKVLAAEATTNQILQQEHGFTYLSIRFISPKGYLAFCYTQREK